jgi:hypothetical protein
MAYQDSTTRPARVAPARSPLPTRVAPTANNGSSWSKSLIALIVIIVIVAAGVYVFKNYSTGSGRSAGDIVMKTDWQAVFLDNGQVYFGKIQRVTENNIVLSDIYYLQVTSQQNSLAQPPDVQTQPEQRLTLIKLGNEIHGPRDEMTINRDHVVLVEDLKADSRVVTAINEFLANGTNPTAPAPTPVVPSTVPVDVAPKQ